MKSKFLFLLLLVSSFGFSQSVNDYAAVMIPLKYDFLKSENQYRLATVTKFNLQKAGFTAFYANEQIPAEYNNRCSFLTVDVLKESGFLVTKLYVVFKDCYGKEVYKSEVGKSREKEFETAYNEALNNAFTSVYALHYKYNGNVAAASPNTAVASPAVAPVVTSTAAAAVSTVAAVATPTANLSDPNLLYAQPTENGYQLIDKTPKVVMKLLKTSRPDSFIAIKEGIQGTLNAKDNQWFFEYYQNDKLVSEKVSVKF